MTFLEAAYDILRRAGKPLHYKELTQKAIDRRLLTFVGRTPDVTMQTQLTNAVKKAPGHPFVRTKPGIFGLLRYPEVPPEPDPPVEPARDDETAPAGRGAERGRRERGRRPRDEDQPSRTRTTGGEMQGDESETENDEAAEAGGAADLTSEARAAALAGSGMLAAGDEDAASGADDEGDEEGEGDEEVGDASAEGRTGDEGAAPQGEGGRRRRRRRRRRGRGGDGGFAGPSVNAEAGAEGAPVETTSEPVATEAPADGSGGRRIATPVDAAIEILKGQAPGRGIHVRQIADAAVRRRLVHGEANEAWRVMRAALAAESKDRLRSGFRPRVRAAGSSTYALARRPPDAELERAEQVFGEARRALRERTLASLESRLAELPPAAFEAIARVLLQREGLGPATFVKRVEGTIYLEALRGRGGRPSRCLIALRPGGMTAGRRAVGELRAGIKARSQDEGLLLTAGRLDDEAVAEWKQPGAPVEIADGPSLAESCVRHGVGVLSASVPVDLVDADFFAELIEG